MKILFSTFLQSQGMPCLSRPSSCSSASHCVNCLKKSIKTILPRSCDAITDGATRSLKICTKLCTFTRRKAQNCSLLLMQTQPKTKTHYFRCVTIGRMCNVSVSVEPYDALRDIATGCSMEKMSVWQAYCLQTNSLWLPCLPTAC